MVCFVNLIFQVLFLPQSSVCYFSFFWGTLWPYNGKIPWQKYQCCTLPFELFLFTQDRAEWFNIALKQRCFRDLKDPRQVEAQLLKCIFKWYVVDSRIGFWHVFLGMASLEMFRGTYISFGTDINQGWRVWGCRATKPCTFWSIPGHHQGFLAKGCGPWEAMDVGQHSLVHWNRWWRDWVPEEGGHFFRLKVNSHDPRERLQRERLGSWFHFGTQFVLGYLMDH